MRPSVFCLMLCCLQYAASGKRIRSGNYGNNLVLVESKGIVYGQYQYRDKWNQGLGFFENVSTFYFYGKRTKGDTVDLSVGTPELETTTGKLVVYANDSIALFTDYSLGYAAVDLKKQGYNGKLSATIPHARKLGIVKEHKCYFYNAPRQTKITRAYITKNEFVTVLKKRGNWYKVQYISPRNATATGNWIESDALYDADPKKW